MAIKYQNYQPVYSSVSGSWSSTNIVGSQTFYTCYSCGLMVESSKWNEHLMVFHQPPVTAYAQLAPGVESNLETRIQRLEAHLLGERLKLLDENAALRDEIAALKSIRGES